MNGTYHDSLKFEFFADNKNWHEIRCVAVTILKNVRFTSIWSLYYNKENKTLEKKFITLLPRRDVYDKI